MSNNRIFFVLLVGILIGVATTSAWFSNKSRPAVDQSKLTHSECGVGHHSGKMLEPHSDRSDNSQTFIDRNATNTEQCDISYQTDLDQPASAKLITQLDRTRHILPQDLSRLNHWTSFTSFNNALEQLTLSESSRQHLLAKAHIFYTSDFIAALESLFSAQQSAINEERLDMFQAEIDVLIDYVRQQYFSENHLIPIDTFTAVMNLANEKQPNNVEVITALVRHHLLVGEYAVAENLIGRVPPDVDNLVTIAQLNKRLSQTMAVNQSSESGIPLQKMGNHFIVQVTFNQEHSLNLMLDTGASRTVLSPNAIQVLRHMTEGVTDLKISGHAETANGFAFTKLYQMQQLSVADFQIDNALVLVMKLSDNPNFDGLLGMDFLSRFEFRIDYQQNRLHLSY